MPTKSKQAPPKSKKKEKITKDILMGELIGKHPEVSEILMKHGLHCVGCVISPYESLEAGVAVHGIPLEPLLKDINEFIDKKNKK